MITRVGTLLGVAGLTLLGLGMVLDYPEVVLAGVAACLVLLAAAVQVAAPPIVSADRHLVPSHVEAGHSAQLLVTITNRGRWPTPPMVITQTLNDSEVMRHEIGVLRGRRSELIELKVAAQPRGVYEAPPLALAFTDAGRLLQRTRRVGSPGRLVVYPEFKQIPPVRAGGPHDLDAVISGSLVSGGDAFYSLREYGPGDDARLIHWPSSARTPGQVMARHNVIPDEPVQVVVLDTCGGRYRDGGFEDAVRVASWLALAALEAGSAVRFRTTDGRVASDFSGFLAQERDGLLELLAAVALAADETTQVALPELVLPHAPAVLVVVTGGAGAEDVAWLAANRAWYSTVCLAQIGAGATGTTPAPLGILPITVNDSDQFADVWEGRRIR